MTPSPDFTPLFQRLKKNYQRLKSFLHDHKIAAWRLYDHDIPNFPVVIDLYCHTNGEMKAVFNWRFNSQLDAGKIHYPREMDQLFKTFAREQLRLNVTHTAQKIRGELSTRYDLVPAQVPSEIAVHVQEKDMFFLVLIAPERRDTGLFLDHRPLRRKLRSLDLPKVSGRALNLFSYTCSLSVALAKAGYQVTSLDIAPKYLDWGKENFRLNQLPLTGHTFHAQDLSLGTPLNCHGPFDVIIVDPPTFSTSTRAEDEWDVERDHLALLSKLKEFCHATTQIYFSFNKQKMKLNPELENIFNIKPIDSLDPDIHRQKTHHLYLLTLKAKKS
jgi:23S rRNA (cytosine1962-C5)-methyltransferase